MKPIHGIFPEAFIGKVTAFLQWLKSAVCRLVTRRKKGGEIFYIGTAGKLPETLTGDEEAAYLADMENPMKRETARKALIEHNLRLVVYIARKYENSVTDGIGMEDFISVGTIGLMKAVETFHSERGIKLATYASRCIENEILMLLRKNAGRHEVSMDEPLSTDWDGNELLLSDVLSDEEDNILKDMEYAEEKKSIQEALSRLTEREQVIIRLRYGLGGSPELTQKEVADKMGISQSYISRLEKKILRRLGSELNGKL